MREGWRMAAGWGAVAHVFVAVAVALPPTAGVALAVGSALVPGQGVVARVVLVGLALALVVVVGAVALLPGVRPSEVALARTLLALDLPDVPHPRAGDSRRRGALWLLVLYAVGLLVALALLMLLPLGLGLLAHPFSGDRTLRWWAVEVPTGVGLEAAWTVLPGMAVTGLALAVVPWSAGRLTRWAPRLLGPTPAELATGAAARERDLARANALAREVHDTIGHRLTAMTIQASLARRLLADPDPARLAAADAALAAVEDLGRRAQQEVDDVVGVLRDPGPAADPGVVALPSAGDVAVVDAVPLLDALLAGQPLPVDADLPARLPLSAAAAETLHGVLREALTNAARHGAGGARLRVVRDGEAVLALVENPLPGEGAPGIPPPGVGSRGIGSPGIRPPGAPGAAGLAGLRERVLLAGGDLDLGAVRDPGGPPRWRVRVRLPLAGGAR